MKQPQDTQIAWQQLTRNLTKLSVLTADNGYDWEFGVANNGMKDETTYDQRSDIESMVFTLRRKYGETVRARTWFGPFRELVLKCAVRSVELTLVASKI